MMPCARGAPVNASRQLRPPAAEGGTLVQPLPLLNLVNLSMNKERLVGNWAYTWAYIRVQKCLTRHREYHLQCTNLSMNLSN